MHLNWQSLSYWVVETRGCEPLSSLWRVGIEIEFRCDTFVTALILRGHESDHGFIRSHEEVIFASYFIYRDFASIRAYQERWHEYAHFISRVLRSLIQ